jgi:hypothetical protein
MSTAKTTMHPAALLSEITGLTPQQRLDNRIPRQRIVTTAKRPSRSAGCESGYYCFYPAVKVNSENPKLIRQGGNPAIAGSAAAL